MRILTRYILGEILSHALIGCALFTFILFMPRLLNYIVAIYLIIIGALGLVAHFAPGSTI